MSPRRRSHDGPLRTRSRALQRGGRSGVAPAPASSTAQWTAQGTEQWAKLRAELSSPPPHPPPASHSPGRQHARRRRGRPAPPRRARSRTGSPDRQAGSVGRRLTGTTCTEDGAVTSRAGRSTRDLCKQEQERRPWRTRPGATLLGALRITRGDYACPSAVGIRPRHIIHQSPRFHHERRAGECRAPGSRPSGLRSQLR